MLDYQLPWACDPSIPIKTPLFEVTVRRNDSVLRVQWEIRAGKEKQLSRLLECSIWSFCFDWNLISEEVDKLVCDTASVWRLEASWETVPTTEESLSCIKKSLFLTNLFNSFEMRWGHVAPNLERIFLLISDKCLKSSKFGLVWHSSVVETGFRLDVRYECFVSGTTNLFASRQCPVEDHP